MALTSIDKALSTAARLDFAVFEREFIKYYPNSNGPQRMDKFIEYKRLDPTGEYSPKKFTDNNSTTLGSPNTASGWIKKALSTQYRNNIGMEEHEFQNMESVINLIVGNEGKIKNIGTIVKDMLTNIGEQVVLNFKQQNDLLMKINENTGMVGVLSRAFREEITEAYPHAIRLGISFSELSDSMSTLVKESGKFKLVGSETIEEMALASKFANSMTEYAALGKEFEKVSLGIKDMTRETNKAGLSSLEIGLNSRTTVQQIGEHLNKLNQYGFKNGIDGLSRMVQKSIEFRMNMEQVTNFADKVWSPEDALKIVANLQVIGGAVGDLNDPLKLMYMATNNIEGLQDSIIGASKSLVTYNNEQKRFVVTGANLRRAKEMADQFGMSLEQLTTTAVASMERTQAASDLMRFNIPEKDREFLTNLSQMKDGRMVIEVPKSLQESLGKQTEIALDKMTDKQLNALLDQREAFKKMTMEDVAREQVSLIENINRDVSFITATMRIQAGKLGNTLAASLGYDPAAIAIESATIANKLHKGIDSQLIFDEINKVWKTDLKHKLIGQVESPSIVTIPTQESKPTTQSTTTTGNVSTHQLNLNIVSNENINEGIKRSILNDPYFQNNLKDSYLQYIEKTK